MSTSIRTVRGAFVTAIGFVAAGLVQVAAHAAPSTMHAPTSASPRASAAASPEVTRIVLTRLDSRSHAFEVVVEDWCVQTARVTAGRVVCSAAGTGPVDRQPVGSADAGSAGLVIVEHETTPTRYAVSRVADLPRLGDFAETTSAAYQQMFVSTPSMIAEHRGSQVLAVFADSPRSLLVRGKPIESLAALQAGRPTASPALLADAAAVAALGARGKVQPQTQLQLSAQSIEDTAGRWQIGTATDLSPAGLGGTVESVAVIAGGVARRSFAFTVSRDSWNAMSAEDRRAILGISGEPLARAFGRAIDAAEWKANLEARGRGVAFYTPGDAFVGQIEQRLGAVDRDWLASARKAGLPDPTRQLARLRDSIKALELAE